MGADGTPGIAFGGGDEPGWQGGFVTDAREVRGEGGEDLLGEVVASVFGQACAAGDGVDERGVLADELIPRLLLASEATGDEIGGSAGHGLRNRIVGEDERLEAQAPGGWKPPPRFVGSGACRRAGDATGGFVDVGLSHIEMADRADALRAFVEGAHADGFESAAKFGGGAQIGADLEVHKVRLNIGEVA